MLLETISKFILKFGSKDGVPSAEEGKFDNPQTCCNK